MPVWLILIPAFVAAFSGIALLLVLAKDAGAQSAGLPTGEIAEAAGSPLLLRDEVVSTIKFWARLLERFDFIHIIKQRTEEAQLDWSVGRITAMMLLSGALAYSLLGYLQWLPGFAIAGGVVLGALTPYFFVLRRRQKRFTSFEEQLPDALDSMCRALRAGHPLPAAIELLALEGMAPVSTEMRKTFDEWKLGMSWDQALDNLATRMPLADVALFGAAVKLHSRSGGKLGSVLANLSESMRESNVLRGEVRAVAAHGKLTATILTVLPGLIAFMMNMVNPRHLELLYNHPYGKNLIAVACGLIVLAHFVMRRILDIRP